MSHNKFRTVSNKTPLARNMGETREELAGKIVANADAYMIGAAQLLGEYQAKVKQINGV